MSTLPSFSMKDGGDNSPPDRADYWKDDFLCLQDAGKEILNGMRRDESNTHGDLYRRILSGTSLIGSQSAEGDPEYSIPSHHYFPNGDWRHSQSIPLPTYLQEQISKAKMSTMMGLFPEAELAYLAVDDKVYLWTYTRSTESEFMDFQVPSHQPIVSVGISPPKKGVFREMVKWCLVVTTKEEAMLCALAKKNEQGLSVVRTKFVIPSDWISFLSVTSTKSGRIFLGGQDGNLYELDYDVLMQVSYAAHDGPVKKKLDEFYDGDDGSCPSVLLDNSTSTKTVQSHLLGKGKRALGSIFSISKQPPRKCRKLNHSQSAVSNFIPDVISKASSAIFGDFASTGGGPICQMVVDHERQVLYTLSTRGWICALDIANTPKITLAATLNAPSTGRLYLEAVSRGRMYPPSTSSHRDGLLSFPGGGEAAQAGVGGMEGARNILKLADTSKSVGHRSRGHSILTPISIQVVPIQESTRITLVAITTGGLRYYLSSLSPHTLGAGPAQPSFRTPRHRDPLKPYSRLTLCHIRAPPSMNPDEASSPSHSPVMSKEHRVDAACYHLGTCFSVFRQPELGSTRQPENLFIVAGADATARLIATKITDREQDPKTYRTPGGICEVISFPMEVKVSGIKTSVGLPGGRVWDICASSVSRNSIQSLALRSKTPTDIELGYGMVPAFIPPSKRRNSPSSAKAALPQSLVAGPTNARGLPISSLAISVFTNLILARPTQFGIDIQRPSVPQDGRQSLYRISQRYGSCGFSLSAADTKSSGNAASTRSARLSPWLLQPEIVPLNPLALQHLESPTMAFMALNAGGLHYFESPSILQQLSTLIVAAGTNIKSDQGITRFFQELGYDEGCALCLVLAMKASSSQDLKEKSLRAALARAYRPTLVPQRIDDQSTHHKSDDPWIPAGYSFTPSALCQGLSLVLSRLLRPIWHKPAVVVTEGRVLKRGTTSKTTPAKVELLLDDDSLEKIRFPLLEMQQVMSRVFGKAVEIVPSAKRRSNVADEMDIDGENNHFLTRVLEYQRKEHSKSASDNLLRPSEAEELAQNVEERNIHSLFRLASRTVQLLSLLYHLRRAHDIPDLPEVEWGLLHGISIAQIVQTREGQERVESMLNSLITSSDMSGPCAIATQSADANRLANFFAEQCYHYFSPGSRYAYLGFQLAKEALNLPIGQSRRLVRARSAKDNLIEAAKNWFSPSLISGRLLHTRQSEGPDEIAERALRHESPLAKACALLIELEDVAGVVEICLLTASNFAPKLSPTTESTEAVLHAPNRVYSWERGLYHRRREAASGGSSAPSNSLAMGASVTGKDAIETCHSLIFFYLTKLLGSPLGSAKYMLGEKMVSVCVSSHDKLFLRSFFDHLLQRSHRDVLLRIDSPDVEKWLVGQQKENPMLLLRYYQMHEKMVDAATVAWGLANSTRDDFELNDRIECLVHSVDAYSSAIRKGQGNTTELHRLKKVSQEKLDIARLQSRVLQAVPSTKYELPEEDMKALSRDLLSGNDLLNKYTMPCDLYDHCLLLLCICRHNDGIHIQKFWKSLICEEVFPISTRQDEVFQRLKRFSEGSLLDSSVVNLLEEAAGGRETLFESGSWMKKVEGRVKALGTEVLKSGTDYIFPVQYIVSCLEDLRQIYALAVPSSVSRATQGWPFSVVVLAGVPHLEALTAYQQLIRLEDHSTMGGIDPVRHLEHLQNVIHCLEVFRSAAVESNHREFDSVREEFIGAVMSGTLLAILRDVRAELQTIQCDVSEEEHRLMLLEEYFKRGSL